MIVIYKSFLLVWFIVLFCPKEINYEIKKEREIQDRNELKKERNSIMKEKFKKEIQEKI